MDGGPARYRYATVRSKARKGHDERLACHVVATVLGVPVKRFDYGTAGQVDALVHYPDRVAALELVGDHDPTFKRQEEAITRVRHQIEVNGASEVMDGSTGQHSHDQEGQRSTA